MKKLSLLAAALLLLTACGTSDDDASGAESFDVLVIAGTTGAAATFAKNVAKAITYQGDKLNEEGGIDGRDVRVTVADSAGDPTKAVSQLQERLTGGDAPDLVYAGISSAETLAMLPVLTREKVLSIAATNNAAINDPDAYPYHFGIAPTAANQLSTVGTKLEELDVEKLAVLTSDDVFGEGTRDGIEQALEEMPDVEADYFTYQIADVNYSTAYQRAVNNDPDAIFMDGNGDAVGRLLSARQDIAPEIPALGGLGFSSVAPGSVVQPEALEGFESVVYQSTEHRGTDERPDSLNEFLDAMDFGTEFSAFNPMLGADSLSAVALAVDQAGSADTEDVADALESLEAPPTTDHFLSVPSLTYSETDHFAQLPAEAYLWITPSTLEDGLWLTK